MAKVYLLWLIRIPMTSERAESKMDNIHGNSQAISAPGGRHSFAGKWVRGHIRELSSDKPFDADDKDAIVVLRVTPKAWVVLVRGKFDRYGWRPKGFLNRREVWSADGFVVAKVTPTKQNEGYAIVEIRPERYSSRAEEAAFTYATALWSPKKNYWGTPVLVQVANQIVFECPVYTPLGEAHLPVFKAVAGQVTYVGAIRIDASKDPESDDPPEQIGVTPVISPEDEEILEDEETVARFITKHYPNVRARVTTRVLKMMRMNEYTD
jgi:hypothetical protein